MFPKARMPWFNKTRLWSKEETGLRSLANAVKEKWVKRKRKSREVAVKAPQGSDTEGVINVAGGKGREPGVTHEEGSGRELYFAYGSCMSEDFARSVPEFTCLGRAVLRDYKLAFTRYSNTRGGGVADIVPVKGAIVEGVLYDLGSELLPELDVREGVKSGAYQRIRVQVESPIGLQRAWTYEVTEKEEEELPPTTEYAQLVLSGARPVVSPAYFRSLKAHIDALQDDAVDW